MSTLGGFLLLFGAFVIAAPLGWIAVTKLQVRSNKQYQRQQDRLDERYR